MNVVSPTAVPVSSKATYLSIRSSAISSANSSAVSTWRAAASTRSGSNAAV